MTAGGITQGVGACTYLPVDMATLTPYSMDVHADEVIGPTAGKKEGKKGILCKDWEEGKLL